jgi:hypothetical protein
MANYIQLTEWIEEAKGLLPHISTTYSRDSVIGLIALAEEKLKGMPVVVEKDSYVVTYWSLTSLRTVSQCFTDRKAAENFAECQGATGRVHPVIFHEWKDKPQ